MSDSPLDFYGPWRDEMISEARMTFLAATTQAEQRAAVDRMIKLVSWKEHATKDLTPTDT